jgi:cytochrome c553
MMTGRWLILAGLMTIGSVRQTRGADEGDLGAPLSASAVASLAATCAGCHGTAGHGVKGDQMPKITGLSQDYFVRQMRAYVEGTSPSTIMQQIAKGYDEQETAALAAYFAAQR